MYERESCPFVRYTEMVREVETATEAGIELDHRPHVHVRSQNRGFHDCQLFHLFYFPLQ
jgi:hypothetical protein